jgi:hypothetical protein
MKYGTLRFARARGNFFSAALAAFAAGALLGAGREVSAGATQAPKFGAEQRLGRVDKNPSTPFLRVSPDGRLYAVWTEDDFDRVDRAGEFAPSERIVGKPTALRAALIAASRDGGKSWSRPMRVNDAKEKVQDGESAPRIAFGADNRVYAVWSATAKSGIVLQGNVRFATEDGKGGFTPARTLNDVDGSGRFPVVETTPDGRLLVAWIDRRGENAQPRRLHLVRLGADGNALAKNFQVGGGTCECCRIGMAVGADGKEIYIASRDLNSKLIRNHSVRKSIDGGATFAPRVEISDDGWEVPFCPDSGPTIVRDERGHLHVTWFTFGRVRYQDGGVYYAVSKDGGRSFSPRQLVGDNPGALLHTALAVAKNGTVYFAWDNLDDEYRSQIFVRALGRDGRSWSSVEQISRAKFNATRPALAVSEKNVHVGWTETSGERSWAVLRSAPLGE